MTAQFPDTRPFRLEPQCTAVLPARPEEHNLQPAWRHLVTLLKREAPELEAELGAPITWADSPARPPGACLLIGPTTHNAALRAWREKTHVDLLDEPYVAIDAPRRLVVVDAPVHDDLSDALQLLRTAIWSGANLTTVTLASSASEVLDRVDAEVTRTFPKLVSRIPHWDTHLRAARDRMSDPDDLATIQELMAHLQDAHSWAKDPRVNGRLPYDTVTDSLGCRFWRVPAWSQAWQLGLRPGDQMLHPEAEPWYGRTGATPHAKPWTIGYRMLSGRVGEQVELVARRANGDIVAWTEQVPPTPWREPISWDRHDRNTGYIRIRTWLNSTKWRDAFVAALDDLTTCERLIVDLRGNPGGALIAAQDARDRFLKRRIAVGSIRFSTITGELAPAAPLVASPPDSGPRWTKPVRFLTDPLCYSATEDFLLGLQGLPQVELVGQSTGGGSGRPRTIALRPHINLTISTALTFDRQGRCIEGNGLAPDILVEPNTDDPDTTLRRALVQ